MGFALGALIKNVDSPRSLNSCFIERTFPPMKKQKKMTGWLLLLLFTLLFSLGAQRAAAGIIIGDRYETHDAVKADVTNTGKR
jgi:hypothetical protein